MTNLPYEERIKNRSIDWYYNKCIRQYHFIIKSISANERYKEEIARLNKIIDELGKDLEYKIKEFEKDGYDLPSVRQQSLWLAGCYDEDKLILQELKELKEEGK